VTNPLKRYFGRARPEKSSLGPRFFDLRSRLKNCAFPSGDSAQASAMMMILALHHSQSAWLIMIIPTMLARIYFGAHWLGDTIAGAIIGMIISYSITSQVL
jgi:membrane-associated phospholipid phosphatase